MRFGVALLVLAVASWCIAWAWAPKESPENHELMSVYPSGTRLPTTSPAWIVSEIDQFSLGCRIVPFVDPFVDAEQAVAIQRYFSAVYLEGRRRKAFQDVGSVMPRAYAELFGGTFTDEHYYLQLPDSQQGGEAVPVVLFLHGSGGNFKGYQTVWRAWANRSGFAVLSPSFGFGNWNRAEAEPLFERMMEWIDTDPRLDGRRIILAGLSNGGLGVSRLAERFPDRFEQVWYLSPVLRASAVRRLTPIWKRSGTPVQILTGGTDRRIPVEFIEDHERSLRHAGVNVNLVVVPAADHFLFFSHREAFETFADNALANE